GEHEVQRLGGRHEDVRRPLHHRLAVGGRRIPGAQQYADVDVGLIGGGEGATDFAERLRQVLLDVVGERLEGRYVNDLNAVGRGPGEARAHEIVDGGEKGGERLPGAGRRGDGAVRAGGDQRPRQLLRLGGRVEALREPAIHEGVEPRRAHEPAS